MSDRARSSVRTEPRAGAGAPDEVPSGAIPVTGSQPAADGQRKGSSAVGTGGGTQSPRSPVAQPPSGQIAVAPAASEKAPAGQAPEVSATQALDAKPAEPPAAQAPAKAAPAAQTPVGKAAQAPAAQAPGSQAPAGQAP